LLQKCFVGKEEGGGDYTFQLELSCVLFNSSVSSCVELMHLVQLVLVAGTYDL